MYWNGFENNFIEKGHHRYSVEEQYWYEKVWSCAYRILVYMLAVTQYDIFIYRYLLLYYVFFPYFFFRYSLCICFSKTLFFFIEYVYIMSICVYIVYHFQPQLCIYSIEMGTKFTLIYDNTLNQTYTMFIHRLCSSYLWNHTK